MNDLAAQPLHVLVLARYGPLAASTRYRLLQYVPILEKQGFVFSTNILLDDEYLSRLYAGQKLRRGRTVTAYARRGATLVRSGQTDLIWLYIEAFPWLPAWWERLLMPRNVPYVVDLDDAMYHRYDENTSPLVRRTLGQKIDQVMAGAALVVAGNQYIAERAARAGAKRIEILPTVVDLTRYQIKMDHGVDRDTAAIGWIGSPATAYNLQLLRPALERLSLEHVIQFITVGSGEVDMGPRINLETRPWSEATEIGDIRRFDIGTMPLVDAAFERGKSGFKLIQCMACGLPVVASPVGANAEIVTHGVNGFLASSADDWFTALKVLSENPALRQEMGAAGRELVEQHYSLQRAAPRLATLLHEAAR